MSTPTQMQEARENLAVLSAAYQRLASFTTVDEGQVLGGTLKDLAAAMAPNIQTLKGTVK